jgi:hypothetical protein
VQNQTPISYFHDAVSGLQWPFIALAAFWMGRSMSRLEARVLKAEKNVQDLIGRHMPHIHKALGDIAGTLEVMKAMLWKR